MAQATARMTVGSIFGMVGTAANTVTGTLDAVADTINMAGAFVTKAANEQRKRHIVDSLEFDNRLADEHAQEITTRAIETVKFRTQSADHDAFYAAAHKRVLEALAPAPVSNKLSAVA
jgi:hydroxylamine reductase (hybrid-cluster protein)